MRVIDSSVIVKCASKEEGWQKADSFLDDAATIDLAIKELGNALWKKIRKNEIALDEAREIISDYRHSFKMLNQAEYFDGAIKIAVEHNISFYDSIFLASALAEGLELVTCDKKQADSAKTMGIPSILL